MMSALQREQVFEVLLCNFLTFAPSHAGAALHSTGGPPPVVQSLARAPMGFQGGGPSEYAPVRSSCTAC